MASEASRVGLISRQSFPTRPLAMLAATLPQAEEGWRACRMPIRLDARNADFAVRFRAFLDTKREASADVEQAVREIIADVAARGDQALIELTEKFDRVVPGKIGLRVTPAELEAATAACEPAALDAL